jgi:D-serine deaminase-like pyridoxal phosphate-dependent protein
MEAGGVKMVTSAWTPGTERDALDTPALLIDLEAMERNMRKMSSFFEGLADGGSPVRLRPHTKTHKCPVLAHKQLEAGGTRGITCAKLGEAEAMFEGGISKGILIANQVVGKRKISRLMSLARHAEVIVCADEDSNVDDLAAGALASRVNLGVLVEVNVGLNRCGLRTVSDAVRLAHKVAKSPGLVFMGLQGFEGHLLGIPGLEARRQAVVAAMTRLIETRAAIEASGLPVQCVDGGGTGTYNITGLMEGMTEIQAGTYIFHDTSYKERNPEFETALTLLTTVISRPDKGTAVLDMGLKSASFDDTRPPQAKDIEGLSIYEAHEEHVVLNAHGPSTELRVGDKIEMIVGHACTTVNLHDRYFGMRRGVLETVWDIAGRGRFD